jgi:hypothetical protein
LAWHNECSTDIAVLDKTLSVGQVELLSKIQSRDARCIRDLQGISESTSICETSYKTTDWNDDIDRDVAFFQNLVNFDSKRIAHGHSTAVHADAIEY